MQAASEEESLLIAQQTLDWSQRPVPADEHCSTPIVDVHAGGGYSRRSGRRPATVCL